MKVFTFFYRKVVVQILTEIVPYLKKICTVTESKKVRQIMRLSVVRQISDKLLEQYLKFKADFTGFFFRLMASTIHDSVHQFTTCLREQCTCVRVYTDVRHARMQ